MNGSDIGLAIKMNKYRTIVKKLLDKENIKSLDQKEIAMLKKDKVIEE